MRRKGKRNRKLKQKTTAFVHRLVKKQGVMRSIENRYDERELLQRIRKLDRAMGTGWNAHYRARDGMREEMAELQRRLQVAQAQRRQPKKPVPRKAADIPNRVFHHAQRIIERELVQGKTDLRLRGEFALIHGYHLEKIESMVLELLDAFARKKDERDWSARQLKEMEDTRRWYESQKGITPPMKRTDKTRNAKKS